VFGFHFNRKLLKIFGAFSWLFKKIALKQSPNAQLSNKPTRAANHWAKKLKFRKNTFIQQIFLGQLFLHLTTPKKTTFLPSMERLIIKIC
jgi:hypothetical protein